MTYITQGIGTRFYHVKLSELEVSLFDYSRDFYRMQHKLRESNVFTGVCQSVYRVGGYLWYQIPSEGEYVQGVCTNPPNMVP